MKFEFTDVFITGANGWLGRQLVESLMNNDKDVLKIDKLKDIKINCLLNKNENDAFFLKFNNKINLVQGDLRNNNTINNFIYSSKKGLLIHTAGIIHPKKVKDFYDINLIGTSNLVEDAVKKNINKIIVISSNSPIGCNPNNKHLFTEKSIYNPYMNYGKSKEMMEKFLLKKIHNGIDITILRPPWFYGENMPDRQNLFYKMVISGRFPIIGNGKNIRSLANVKNICQAILLSSILKISKGKIYWIADDKNYNMIEILEIIKRVYKDKFNIQPKKNFIKIPFFVGQLFELLDYLIQKTGFYSQKIHVLSELNKNIACDISLAKKELNYMPKIGLYEGTFKVIKQLN
jgi:nucleoside-diphosphate-sugar epimerase